MRPSDCKRIVEYHDVLRLMPHRDLERKVGLVHTKDETDEKVRTLGDRDVR